MPISGQLPVGFALDPCTVGVVPLDYRGTALRAGAERAARLAFVDFIEDVDPDFTMKNQIFYDNIDWFKNSYLPYGEHQ